MHTRTAKTQYNANKINLQVYAQSLILTALQAGMDKNTGNTLGSITVERTEEVRYCHCSVVFLFTI